MTEKLSIKKFGPIVDAELDLKRYVLFIGSQASGKSTIGKLIAIFRDAEFVLREKDRNRLFKNYGIDKYFFNGDTYLFYKCDNYTITYEKTNWIIILNEDFKQQVHVEEVRINGIITSFVNTNDQYIKNNENEKKELISSLVESNWSNLFSVLKKQIYIPAERNLVTTISGKPFVFGNLSLVNCLKQFGTRFDFAKQDIQEFPIDFLNVTYKNENGENKIYISENKSIPLSESASGMQVAIPLILVFHHLVNSKNDFIIEEPEMNLFPTVQKELINFLVSRINTSPSNSSLVLTTHSPYILTILNNLLFAYKTSEENKKDEDKINRIVSKDKWINPKEFSAYYLSNGKSHSILDQETGLITHNELDAVSQNLSGERDALLDFY